MFAQVVLLAVCLLCGVAAQGIDPQVHSIHRRSVRKAASIGGSKLLECDIMYPDGLYNEHIITWKKQGIEVPIFIQFNGYSPHIDPSYQGRLRLVEQATIELGDIRTMDEGWYECSIVFLDLPGEESETNGTWIYLSVNSPPVLGPVSPSFMIQQEGDTVDMFCEATGTPEPTLTWFKDSKKLVEGDRVIVSGNRIQVKDLVRNDGGVYTCNFKNIVGQVSHIIKLVIEGNAYIMSPPKNTTTNEGTSAKLTCHAEGYPNNITYRWFKNGVDVQLVAGLMSRAGIFPDGALNIGNVHRQDTGWYKCRPSNGLGPPPESSAYLNITYPPRVLTMPARLYLPKGMVGRIECPVDANPPMTQVTWHKDSVKISTRQSPRLMLTKQGTLIIKSVITEDEGQYTCSPMSALGAGPVSSAVQVLVRDPPHFVVRPSPVYQRELQQAVSMPCVAMGQPQPTITWRKADGTFPSSTKTLQNGGNLTIANLGEMDRGTYECVASNVVTSVITTTLLLIESTPPHAPYNITVETTQYSAKISWLPAYNAGSYQHYVLWYKLQTGNRQEWHTVRVVPDDATSITVYSLQPNSRYQFAVHSRNAQDEGLFSKVVSSATKGFETSSENSGEKGPNSPTPTLTGPKPSPPRNVTVRQQHGLLISWLPPLDRSVPFTYYVIEYRTVAATWLPLADKIAPRTQRFTWKTMSHGATYHFQMMTCYDKEYRACSVGSEVVTIATGDPMAEGGKLTDGVIGGIVGGLLFLLVAMILAVLAVKIFNKRKQRERDMRYGNVKYFGPNQVEANKKSAILDLSRSRGSSAVDSTQVAPPRMEIHT